MKKFTTKKYKSLLILSSLVLSPLALSSCVLDTAITQKNQRNNQNKAEKPIDQEQNQNPSPMENDQNQSLDTIKEQNSNSENKLNNQDQKLIESPKLEDENKPMEKEDSAKEAPEQEIPKQEEPKNNPPASKDVEKDSQKQENQDSQKNQNSPSKPESNNAQSQNKPETNLTNWWESSGGHELNLTSSLFENNKLTLNFDQEIPENLKTTLTLKKVDATDQSQEKTIEFTSKKSTSQMVELSSLNLEQGKWEISQILFNVYAYKPSTKMTFEVKTTNFEEEKAKLVEKQVQRIKEYFSSHVFEIKEKAKDKKDVNSYALSDFNLNLQLRQNESKENIISLLLVDQSNDSNLIKEPKLLLKSLTEDKSTKKRIATFKIWITEKDSIEKTLEWSYKTNEDFISEFTQKSPNFQNLKNKVDEFFASKLNLIPFELNKLNTNIPKIVLDDEIEAFFEKIKSVDDFKGSATLEFKVKRADQEKLISLNVEGFAKVANIEAENSKRLRKETFDISSSSNGLSANDFIQSERGRVLHAQGAFSTIDEMGDYWQAGKNDANPWLQIGWKNGKSNLLYGLQIGFLNGFEKGVKDYYRENAYRIEYQEKPGGKWISLENPKITGKRHWRLTHQWIDTVEIKKHVHAARVVFIKDKKPKYPSILYLMPIVKKAN
ncbi:hypothetical protein [Mycoplasmopsis pulmonis]|uniref:hypothetical protein n=1 Tax=Mycoplasmopsis pulmonis TaxID=2107 RepID=UPI002ACDC257|nr:hypothetical protein [Mycoplasmopsis pulmonis]MDZ7293481.1 hypothetical protein [Mycoplasmopsis pulmonis]